jgi:hypothetical protein
MSKPLFELHAEPDKEVIRRWKKLQALKNKGQTIAYTQLLRHLLKTDIWFIARYAFGYWFLDETLHSKELLQWYKDTWDNDTMTLFPRGHCKTNMNNVIMTWIVINNPNVSMLYVADVAEKAEQFCNSLAHNWMTLPLLQEAFPEIFPSRKSESYQWSKKGYFVKRTGAQRRDPTLVSMGATGTPTGLHPDFVFVDDIVGLSTNNEPGWNAARLFLTECSNLTQEMGVIKIIGTFWSDRAPYRDIVDGIIAGGRGKYRIIVKGCFRTIILTPNPLNPDEPIAVYKDPIYPSMPRLFDPPGSMAGHTEEVLLEKRETNPTDFACQYLNDPKNTKAQAIDASKIKASEHVTLDLPLHRISAVVIDTNAGSQLVYGELRNNNRYSSIPIIPFELKQRGISKHQRISMILEPYINKDKVCYPKDVNIGTKMEVGTLLYELTSVENAMNDDLADAFHMAVSWKGAMTAHQEWAWPIMIGCDFAFTIGTKADHTAFVAFTVDNKDQIYILDTMRFQSNQTTVICDNLLQFYNKWKSLCNADAASKGRSRVSQYGRSRGARRTSRFSQK